MSLVLVGSVAIDTIETPWGNRERIVGGSGTYCALSASYFTRPKIVAVVGEDFPQETLDLFRSKGIDIRGLKIEPGKTFFWKGRYGYDPNQRTTVALELNVFGNFKPDLPEDYRDAEIVFLANIDPDFQAAILAQMRKPRLVAMDTISHWISNKPGSLDRVLEKSDIFFANDEEIRMLTREANLIKAGKQLLGRGPRLTIVKKGEHGALIFGKDFVFGVMAHPCEDVIDPTGAGDSFAGGFLGYLDKKGSFQEKDIRRAAVYGSVLASFTIEDFGIGRLKGLTLEEVEERFAYFKKLVTF